MAVCCAEFLSSRESTTPCGSRERRFPGDNSVSDAMHVWHRSGANLNEGVQTEHPLLDSRVLGVAPAARLLAWNSA